jgi:hypothetical protein
MPVANIPDEILLCLSKSFCSTQICHWAEKEESAKVICTEDKSQDRAILLSERGLQEA